MYRVVRDIFIMVLYLFIAGAKFAAYSEMMRNLIGLAGTLILTLSKITFS